MPNVESMIFLLMLAGVATGFVWLVSRARSRFARAFAFFVFVASVVAAVRFWINARATGDYEAMVSYVGFFFCSAIALGVAGGLGISVVRAAR